MGGGEQQRQDGVARHGVCSEAVAAGPGRVGHADDRLELGVVGEADLPLVDGAVHMFRQHQHVGDEHVVVLARRTLAHGGSGLLHGGRPVVGSIHHRHFALTHLHGRLDVHLAVVAVDHQLVGHGSGVRNGKSVGQPG